MVLLSAGFTAGLVALAVAGVPAAAPGGVRAGGADLAVRLAVRPRVAQPGQWLTYQARVRNSGPGDAVLPVLTIRVPDEVDVAAVNVTTCRPGRSGHVVVCPSSADIPAGATGAVTVVGLVSPDARGPLRASARLSSEVVDGRDADNRAVVTTRVDEGADLAVRLSASPPSARPGQRFTVTAAVRNAGPHAVADARMRLTGRDARFLSARGARCAARGGRVGCALHPIRPGARGTLSLVFRVPRGAAGPAAAEAMIYSRRFGDRRPADNLARARVPVRPAGRRSGRRRAAGPHVSG
ncbi:hypothetical protein Sru01_05460 [Sphaerisporangium rufum]|uniref:DUF11 domain-containing protein n=1 Tax=Sphaerisporangium rufum TaxID=1381558 RepID=A0A919QWS9_9ACTN|nr:DUF11 domain-containing protein [Sphaerisporangium rufum]GII75564.1 hypothetical protein Sru01_05460 [Sphaerisporangium rufum]